MIPVIVMMTYIINVPMIPSATTTKEYVMNEPHIAVIGATGRTGGAVVHELRRRGMPVRAIVRSDDARCIGLRRAGAQVRIADLLDPDRMTDALAGIRHVYFVPPFVPHLLHYAGHFAVAARAARVEAIVQLSQWLSHARHPSVMTRETWLVDQWFASLPGIAHVVVDPGMFADNFLRVIDYATLLGVYPVLTGESRSAPVATEDIAAVVAAVLCDPGPHAGKRLRPTGPKLLTGREMATEIGRAIGRRVRAVELPFPMFLKAARQAGAPIHEILNYRDYLADHRRGAFEAGGGVNDLVARLAGRPAEAFAATAARYAAMPFAQRTLRNRLTAMARFAILPFLPGYPIDRYARGLAVPTPPDGRLAHDDPQWRHSHGLGDAAPG